MKLYRFAYSCYARKVQMVLDLLGRQYRVVEVPFGDRNDLATLTGGYIQVPVLVDDVGTVIVDSRAICEHLLRDTAAAAQLVPSPWDGPVWAYADWCDGALEDILFRIASPGVRANFARPADRALFTFIKERKFGRGCVDTWERGAADLLDQARAMVEPTLRTLQRQPFICGERPTLADAALYGQCAMLRAADVRQPDTLAPALGPWMSRMEAAVRRPPRSAS